MILLAAAIWSAALHFDLHLALAQELGRRTVDRQVKRRTAQVDSGASIRLDDGSKRVGQKMMRSELPRIKTEQPNWRRQRRLALAQATTHEATSADDELRFDRHDWRNWALIVSGIMSLITFTSCALRYYFAYRSGQSVGRAAQLAARGDLSGAGAEASSAVGHAVNAKFGVVQGTVMKRTAAVAASSVAEAASTAASALNNSLNPWAGDDDANKHDAEEKKWEKKVKKSKNKDHKRFHDALAQKRLSTRSGKSEESINIVENEPGSKSSKSSKG
eukprot:gb/GFBE01022234.1/.p1 GENE.gb/GFBE01022234.1/~~gb/GFBE01022234.1/.p1  ORF type:complete len:275 (+),score=63.18 gb/GFBE01022234.1/:1-825(+)